MQLQTGAHDPAHDFLHLQRVVRMAKILCQGEGANWAVVMPAAWLHDFVVIPKDDLRRSQASKISAVSALEYLKKIQYPESHFPQIRHAIEAHSFSAGIEACSLEAQVVQDADRLDALGAIGIARCFATAGLLKREFYESKDPFCKIRPTNDKKYTLDHFYQKLFPMAKDLKTATGRKEADRRIQTMKIFIEALTQELPL